MSLSLEVVGRDSPKFFNYCLRPPLLLFERIKVLLGYMGFYIYIFFFDRDKGEENGN